MALRACQFVLQVLVVLEQFSNRQCLVGQVDAEFVAIRSQCLDMLDHSDSVHCSLPKFIILRSKRVIITLKLGYRCLEVTDAI